jgi:hypothetical protein
VGVAVLIPFASLKGRELDSVLNAMTQEKGASEPKAGRNLPVFGYPIQKRVIKQAGKILKALYRLGITSII